MNAKKLRRLLLKTCIGFLTLTALIGLVSVLTGKFNQFQLKVLGTTLLVSMVSLCSIAAAAFIEIRRREALGLTGIGIAVLAGLASIIGIWSGHGNDDVWRLTVTLIVVASVFTYSFLTALPHLAPAYRWCYKSGPVLAGLLGMQVLLMTWGVVNGKDWYRIQSATLILVVLNSLVEPILARMSQSGTVSSQERLILTKQEEGVFADPEGQLYRVEPLSTEES